MQIFYKIKANQPLRSLCNPDTICISWYYMTHMQMQHNCVSDCVSVCMEPAVFKVAFNSSSFPVCMLVSLQYFHAVFLYSVSMQFFLVIVSMQCWCWMSLLFLCSVLMQCVPVEFSAVHWCRGSMQCLCMQCVRSVSMQCFCAVLVLLSLLFLWSFCAVCPWSDQCCVLMQCFSAVCPWGVSMQCFDAVCVCSVSLQCFDAVCPCSLLMLFLVIWKCSCSSVFMSLQQELNAA